MTLLLRCSVCDHVKRSIKRESGVVGAETIHFIDFVNVWATKGRRVQINQATAAVLLVVMWVNSLIFVNANT